LFAEFWICKKPYFKSVEGAEKAPNVEFDFTLKEAK
jgi:hypothetical protein